MGVSCVVALYRREASIVLNFEQGVLTTCAILIGEAQVRRSEAQVRRR